MDIRLLPLAAALLLAALIPSSAQAASCSDYKTQAEAQQAADTVDADGDGRYCESLPCPCAGGEGDAQQPPAKTPARKPSKGKAQTIRAQVTAAVDGDTIRARALEGGRSYTVRLLGIDTPETKRPGVAVECGGPQASSNMLSMIFSAPKDTDGDGLFDKTGGTGVKVSLKTDPTQDTTDRYGRLLAYVTTLETDADLGLLQIRAGWAARYVFASKPVARDASYRKAESQAKKAGRGIWQACDGDVHSEQD